MTTTGNTFIIGCPGCNRAVRCVTGRTGALCPVCHSELPSEPPKRASSRAKKSAVKPAHSKAGHPVTARQITLIHTAKTQIGMSEIEYRGMLESFGVKSCKDLDQRGFERLVAHLNKCGFGWVPSGGHTTADCHQHTEPQGKDALLKKISAQLGALGLPWSYADSMANRMFKVALCKWLKPAQLRSVVAALAYHQDRQTAQRQRDVASTVTNSGGSV